MGESMPALFLDIVILVLLGVTIYYAIRLTRSLESFRNNREAFEGLISDLTRSIAQAQSAIETLKRAEMDTGKDLQDRVNDARVLVDELRLINDTGNSLANRLEKLAERTRESVKPPVVPVIDEDMIKPERRSAAASVTSRASSVRRAAADPVPDFFIQDRDFDDEAAQLEALSSVVASLGGEADILGADDGEEFSSEAERELMQALRRNKRGGSILGGGRKSR